MNCKGNYESVPVLLIK